MRLDGKASSSVDVVSRLLQGSVLGSLLLILGTFELFHIVGNSIVLHAVILRCLSRSQ